MSAASRLEPTRAGVPAPDFTLPDAAGGWCRPLELFHEYSLVLVFYRGHWCPYCRRYLSKLQANLSRIEAAGGRVVAVSPEPAFTGASMARELGLTFKLLSDADGSVINRFGTRNGFMGGGSVLPHPSVFVIDKESVIRFRSIDRNFKKRTTIRSILHALGELVRGASATPTEVSSPV
jgi:peroxiredoxin